MHLHATYAVGPDADDPGLCEVNGGVVYHHRACCGVGAEQQVAGQPVGPFLQRILFHQFLQTSCPEKIVAPNCYEGHFICFHTQNK